MDPSKLDKTSVITLQKLLKRVFTIKHLNRRVITIPRTYTLLFIEYNPSMKDYYRFNISRQRVKDKCLNLDISFLQCKKNINVMIEQFMIPNKYSFLFFDESFTFINCDKHRAVTNYADNWLLAMKGLIK